MLPAIRKLALGIVLIIGASTVLLVSDWNRRGQGSGVTEKVRRVAIFQFASNSILDENVAGMIDALAKSGFVDGQTISIQRFNAEGDFVTANTIAKALVTGHFDLVLTSSTPALQTMASANKDGNTTHVFAAVTDPFGAGVGISGANPLDHPRHLVGIGTFQPVEHTFHIAKEIYPGLTRVGVVWNASEACSEACVLKARKACKEMGVELLEANVENSAGVLEAARSLVGRGAQALWIGGDNTVETATDSVAAAAREGRIPVFSNTPASVKRGELFALGADYFEVGTLAGKLAAEVLKGGDPASVRIENIVPEKLVVDTSVLQGLKDPWRIPPGVMARASAPDTAQATSAARLKAPEPGRTYKVGLVYFAPEPGADLVIRAVQDALRDRGFVEGKNLEFRQAHAQAEISNITQLLQNFDNSDVDAIVTLTTPCLTAASATVKRKPVVFAYVYDPIAAGAGKSMIDHLSHVTGIGSFPPLEESLAVYKRFLPRLKSLGIIYNSSEANSRKVVEVARGLCRKQGTRLEEVPVTGTSEVYLAAQVAAQKNVDAIWIAGDNTATIAFDAIANVASKAKLPVLTNDIEAVDKGATLAVQIGFYQPGYEAGLMVSRILLGEKPATMPMQNITKKRIEVNFVSLKALGLTVPADILKESVSFYNLRAKLGRPARVAMVQIVDNPVIDESCEGFIKGLEEAHLGQGTDFVLRRFNAQGDVTQLPLIMSAIKSEGADLVVTSGTPVLLTAARAIHEIPIVFTVASDPKVLGIFQGNQRPPNITGVYDDPPLDRVLDLALKREAPFATVGTVWDPSQPNSEISVKKLRKACRERKLTLVEAAAAVVSDLPQATESLCQRHAGIIVISADNLTTTGFPGILGAAKKNGVPVYATEPRFVERGAAGAIGDDYVEWGKQSGHLAAKVLAGVSPNSLPPEKTRIQRTAVAK
ncbi:MAG TPA: ABC transporter substrate-binding protein [Terriglobia bacterium]|nr:ABC transporter substrate-binding protein [Terriglobia bacterium]